LRVDANMGHLRLIVIDEEGKSCKKCGRVLEMGEIGFHKPKKLFCIKCALYYGFTSKEEVSMFIEKYKKRIALAKLGFRVRAAEAIDKYNKPLEVIIMEAQRKIKYRRNKHTLTKGVQ